MMITPRHSAALVLLLAGCQDGTRAEPDRRAGGGSGDPIPLTRLAQDSSAYTRHSGIGSPRQAVVRDSAGWRQLWEEIHATVTPVPELPEVEVISSSCVPAPPSASVGISTFWRCSCASSPAFPGSSLRPA